MARERTDTDDAHPTRRRLLKATGTATFGAATLGAASGTAAGVEEEQMLSYRSHPGLPGVRYVGSLQMHEICPWARRACYYAGLKHIVGKLPGSRDLVAGLCGAGIAGCQLVKSLQDIADCETGWVHVYRPKWFFQPLAKLWSAHYFLLPEGVYTPCN